MNATSKPNSRKGMVLDGKYEILEEVGRGGMGAVYLARDKRLNKQWAVKEFLKSGDRFQDDEREELFLKEANVMRGLDHPGLPRIVDIIEADDTIFIVMDFVEGESLSSIMKRQGRPFTEKEAVDLGVQLCDVLDYLHTPITNASDPSLSKPVIVYRDLKPSNIMVNDGAVRLVDFGIARKFDGGKKGDTIIGGTEGYAPPEQVDESVETDPRADIYSLGITLHYLLTGRNPRKDVHHAQPIRVFNPALSEGLEAVIAKCVRYNREDRYQSCREVAYDLEHYEELTPAFQAKKRRKLNIFTGLSAAAVVFFVIGVGCLIGSNAVRQSTYEASFAEGNNIALADYAAPGDLTYAAKIQAFEEAIKADSSHADPYTAILDVYIADGEFSSDEIASYLSLLTDYAGGNCSGYSSLCYAFANSCFSYASNYSQASTWFGNALSAGGLSEEQTSNANTYKVICDFHKNLDSREILGSTGDDSQSFVDYWKELEAACDSLDNSSVTPRSKLKLYELIVDACSSEAYTLPFMAGGLTQSDLTSRVNYVENQTKALESQLVYTTDRDLYTYILQRCDGGTDASGGKVESAYSVIERTYNSASANARISEAESANSAVLGAGAES